MSSTHSGNGWKVELENRVMVWEFLPGMELSAFEDKAYPVYEELLTSHDIDGMVTVVEVEDAFGPDIFEVWENSARRAETAGVKRWAVVADGIKAISLRGKVDTGGMETHTTEDRKEAIDWAQG